MPLFKSIASNRVEKHTFNINEFNFQKFPVPGLKQDMRREDLKKHYNLRWKLFQTECL